MPLKPVVKPGTFSLSETEETKDNIKVVFWFFCINCHTPNSYLHKFLLQIHSPKVKSKFKRIKPLKSSNSDTSDEAFKKSYKKRLRKKKSFKRTSNFESKISSFFRKQPKTPEASQSDEENTPTSTVFLSDEEFQELSKRLSDKKSDESSRKSVKRKLSQLSWAPDLLSDLPSSIGSDIYRDFDYNSDSDYTTR